MNKMKNFKILRQDLGARQEIENLNKNTKMNTKTTTKHITGNEIWRLFCYLEDMETSDFFYCFN
jgi:hypothetical protein